MNNSEFENRRENLCKKLEELFPEIEERICPADREHIKNAHRLMEQGAHKAIVEAHALYLKNLAENHSYYKSNKKDARLLREAVALMREY